MDFDLQDETRKCLVSTLCSLKLPDLVKKGKERVGIVVNTDPHARSRTTLGSSLL
jgi:hypothetical protein